VSAIQPPPSLSQKDSLTPATLANERHSLIRERVFPPSQLEKVLLLVHEERFTGAVTLDCSQGGLCAIRMNEQQKIEKGDPR
jgi:hypothetical protein